MNINLIPRVNTKGAMLPQENWQARDENFFFESGRRGELVVNAAVLPEHTPTALVLQDGSIVGTYVDREGNTRTEEHRDTLSWTHDFQGGDQLLKIETGSGAIVRSQDENTRVVAIGGDKTGEYEIKAGDLLITEVLTTDSKVVVVVAADEPLPESQNNTRYQPLGVITKEGKLVSWGEEGRGANYRLDLVIADRLASNLLEYRSLDWRLGSLSLEGFVDGSEPTSLYLKWFKFKFGEDYLPTSNPRERMRELDETLTDEQRHRPRPVIT